jgi:hypothetical protein
MGAATREQNMKNGTFAKGLILGSAMLGSVACTNGTALVDDDGRDVVAPTIAANGDFRVAIEPEVSGLVDVRSREFASMEELFRFAMEEMGGEPVHDEEGNLVGVRGSSVVSGDVRFRDEDTGEIFESDDLAQAYLGGVSGSIQVAGEVLPVGAPVLMREDIEQEDIGVATAALSGSSSGCAGEDCISGHSWRTNYIVYRSVGSETKQSSGGYGTYTYNCCRSGGSLVTSGGRSQCRYVTEWEPANPELGQYRPIPIAYGYRNPDTCSGTATRNTLTLGVTAIGTSGWQTAYAERTEANTREVSFSNWGVGIGVSFLGIDDVAGVCGYHTGSRGTTTRTRAGSATDRQCDPNLSFELLR